MIIKNKRGWIRIIEAFIAILLICGILFVSLDSGRVIGGETRKIYSMEQSMLKEVQLDKVSREEILGFTVLPSEWDAFSHELKNQIGKRKLNYIDCKGKICALDDLCELEELPEENIYVQEIAIFADSVDYNPRKLKLFCWEK